MRTLILSLALAAGAASPAFAQERTATPMQRPDPLGDATLTKADALARAGALFDKADANKDGSLATDELTALRPPRRGNPSADAAQGGAKPSEAQADRPRRRSGGGGGMRGLRMADANNDGVIARDEFLAAQTRMFDTMDADKDGQVTKAERDAARAAMRARMEQRLMQQYAGGGGGEGASASDGD